MQTVAMLLKATNGVAKQTIAVFPKGTNSVARLFIPKTYKSQRQISYVSFFGGFYVPVSWTTCEARRERRGQVNGSDRIIIYIFRSYNALYLEGR